MNIEEQINEVVQLLKPDQPISPLNLPPDLWRFTDGYEEYTDEEVSRELELKVKYSVVK